MQLGYRKFCSFLCEWDIWARADHYIKWEWSKRKSLEPGVKNVIHVALVERNKILLPLLHVKLGLMKNFVKAIDWEFPTLSLEKIKAGVFVGPQIRELIVDIQFDNTLEEDEKTAWENLKSVVRNFLGNNRAHNYQGIVKSLLDSFQTLGCNMSLKLHFLHSRLDFFPSNCADVSDEHGERLH